MAAEPAESALSAGLGPSPSRGDPPLRLVALSPVIDRRRTATAAFRDAESACSTFLCIATSISARVGGTESAV